MDDFTFDIVQKKKIASGARHRVCGRKSKRCFLPSDFLTPAQIRKRNGEVITMNLGEPMSWKEFKSMSHDLQKEYIEKCIRDYDCKIAQFCELFGVHHDTVKLHLRSIGCDMSTFKAGSRMSADNKEKFEKWLHKQTEIPHEEPSLQETKSVHIGETPAEEKIGLPIDSLNHLEMEYVGNIPFAQILSAAFHFANGNYCKIRIILDKVESHE